MKRFKLFFIILLLHLSQAQEEYTTYHFKDEMKVESFAFSEDENFMVVLQDFRFMAGSIENLPHLIYKKAQNGYVLMGKQSYERVVSNNGYLNNLVAVGKIQINKAGTIFVSGHSDNVVRVFQIKDGITRQIQKIYAKKENGLYYLKLTYKGDLLQVNNVIYKWIEGQFREYYTYASERNVAFLKFYPLGEFIIGMKYNQLHIYKDTGKTMDIFKKVQKPEGITSDNIYIGSQDNKKYTVIFQATKKNQTTVGQLRCYQLQYPFDKFVFKQAIDLNVEHTSLMKIYLTNNGRYLGFIRQEGQSLFVYEKKEGEFKLMNKFWNFTKGPSDIYISEDAGLIAVANRFISHSDAQKYSKDEQIAFFYKCNIPGCIKCSWSRACIECRQSQYPINNKCSSSAELEQSYSVERASEIKQREKKQYKNIDIILKADLFVLSLLLGAILCLTYLFLICLKKICQKCGVNFIIFELKKKNRIQFNEEIQSAVENSDGVINLPKKRKDSFSE